MSQWETFFLSTVELGYNELNVTISICSPQPWIFIYML